MPVAPFRNSPAPAYHRGGTFMISRDKLDEIQLIELLDFGPNGIALRDDEKVFTVSNCIDAPMTQGYYGRKRDMSKIYVRGYRIEQAGIEPFMYFDPYMS